MSSFELVAEYNLPQDATPQFQLKTELQPGMDQVTLTLDYANQGTWNTAADWTLVEVPVPAGAHTLRWRYTRSVSRSQVISDAVYVDDIQFVFD